MGRSTATTVVISIFLIAGMLLAGVLTQPEASLEAWDVNESDFPANASSEEKLTFLIRYAILAPSIYNTQPWRFNVSGDEILVFADKSRWLQVADRDQRELYLSLGCSLENLLVAADHFGYNCSVTYFPGQKDLVAKVVLQPGAQPSLYPRLFSAIALRQTNRSQYEERAIKDADLITLQNPGPDQDAQTVLVIDSATKKRFIDLSARADRIQFGDVNFKSELGRWLGEGGMGSTGLQAKIDQMELVLLDRRAGWIGTDSEQILSTPYLGFIITGRDDNKSKVLAGQLLERTWLMATSMGVSLQPMSQALQVPETEEELASLIPSDGTNMSQVQQIFRLGYARESVKEHSPRRPLEEVLI